MQKFLRKCSPVFAFLCFSLFAVCVECKKGGKRAKIDLAGDVLNPDPKATGIVWAEFNQGPGLVEGDMMISSDKGAKGGDRNAMRDQNKLWPQATVPYVINENIKSNPGHVKKIEEAIFDYNHFTCVKFVPRTNEEDYVMFTSASGGCFAYLGRSGGRQPINLGSGCWSKGTVIHEMLHTLGFAHEQSRGDRDDYITVNYDSIPKGWKYQFRKLPAVEENNMGFKYDYSSVMHYPGLKFGGFDKPSISTKDPRDQRKIGQRAGFSVNDVKEVNKYYKCDGKVSGVGGENGCLDKQSNYCQNTLGMKSGPNYHCKFPDIIDSCKKSCGACGAGATPYPLSTTTTKPPCEDGEDHYCLKTLGLKDGMNSACDYEHIADYCRKSCGNC